MKSLSCRDFSGEDCQFQAIGENDGELIRKIMRHSQKKHIDLIEDLSVSDIKIVLNNLKNRILIK